MFFVGGCILYGGCASPSHVPGEAVIGRSIQKAKAYHRLHQPAPPESEWNASGVWVKVADTPARYIPSAYSRSASRAASAGQWFGDDRDGKQLFVPRNGVGVWPEGTLRGEAIRITMWHRDGSIPGHQEIPLKERFTR